MVCRIFDIQGGIEQYDEVVERVGEEEKPEGVHAHIAVKTDGGFKVIEVWDSEEQIDRYMTEGGLGQALQEAQVPEPNIKQFEVHNSDWGRR